MILRALSYRFSYSEKAYSPTAYTSLLTSSLPTQTPNVHPSSLRKSSINFHSSSPASPHLTTSTIKLVGSGLLATRKAYRSPTYC